MRTLLVMTLQAPAYLCQSLLPQVPPGDVIWALKGGLNAVGLSHLMSNELRESNNSAKSTKQDCSFYWRKTVSITSLSVAYYKYDPKNVTK